MRHRGPDDDGTHVDGDSFVGLGATRLAIIDLSAAGHQPLRSADGNVTLVLNGEIYNFRELRRDLEARGHKFRGHSDTEVLLAGYIEYGIDVLDRIDGIFAFALFDKRTATLLLARDRAGIKPLYYVQAKNGFVFGSEIKSLLQLADIAREPDVAAIHRYLTFLWAPGEQTALRGVLKLSPGTALIVKDGVVARKWVYAELPRYSPRRDWTAKACAAELHELLSSCVTRQMVSDAPLGAFLSGGVDSSALVAAARQTAPDIHCFTIELEGERESGFLDDLPYAKKVADYLDVPLTCVRVNANRVADKIADMMVMLDEPLADPACLNTFFISEVARSGGIKVLLSGLGGDDLFSGYRRHAFAKFDYAWSLVPQQMRKLAAGFDRKSSLGRRLAKSAEASFFPPDERLARIFAWLQPEAAATLLAAEVREGLDDINALGPLIQFLKPFSDLPTLEKCLALDRRFFLADHNLIYTDKMSMAASVEVRVPYLDDALLAFAAQIPAQWKYPFLTPKGILKKAEASVLPPEVIHRRKTGFGVPLRGWIKQLGDLVNDLLAERVIEQRGLFDYRAVNALRAADAAGQIDATYTIFSILCVELWCRSFVDVATPRGPMLDFAFT
jgi:asparagine synthase (glutamine-hydrolysing)